MAVTLKQVAERSGLSAQAVSQILNDRGKSYREASRERVFQAARELGYRPNASARAVRSGRFGCVALVRSTVHNRSTLFRDLLVGIEDALAAHDLHLALARLPDQTLTDPEAVPKILREWMSDGLLLNYHHDIPPRLQALLEEYRLPYVWINAQHPHDCVHPDDLAAGWAATERLLRLGHTRIAYGTIVTTHYSAADRQAGYERAMREAGLTPLVLVHAGGSAEGVPLWRAALSGPERPTAVLAYMPHVAQAVLYVALTSGLRLPGDLSLATFNEAPLDVGLPVTTWLIPEHAMGRAAVEMLVEKIAAPAEALPPLSLPFGFDPGATSAPPL